MDQVSIILLAAAAASILLLLALRRTGSKLYNRSSGVGLVLIVFPISLAAFADLQWLVAILMAPVGLSIWLTDLFREPR